MPKYKALITRDCTESVVIEVEADNKELAVEAAYLKARSTPELAWEYNDGSCSDPYFGDEDEDVQEITDV